MLKWMPCLLLALATLAACTTAPETTEEGPEDAIWEGELRILPNDTAFMPCGIHRAYRLTGPGLDSLSRRYAWLKTVQGQWIKTWCSGHLAAPPPGGGDTVLVATAYGHMDAEVLCPPVPVDSLVGTYEARSEAIGGEHVERLDFISGGQALIITTRPGLYAEVDGRWGLDADGDIRFTETDHRFGFYYGWRNGMLERSLPNRGSVVTYRRIGPADPMAGAPGRTARWLAAVSGSVGRPLQAGDLQPSMPLDSLFPDTAARSALRRSAADTLGFNDHQLATTWRTTTTVHDVTKLMRIRMQAAR